MQFQVPICRIALVAAAAAWTGGVQAQNIFGGPGVPAGWVASYAYGVDATGAIVVGQVDDVGFGSHAVIVSMTNGSGTDLGYLPGGMFASASAVSADGNVIVGYGDSAAYSNGEAFRWTLAGGMVGLGVLPGGIWSNAYAVSADGGVVVGSGNSAAHPGQEAFRWTAAGGMVGLGTLAGGTWSNAFGVSADGSVVVGNSDSAAYPNGEAYRWTAAGGMAGLGVLAGGTRSIAYGVSADGSVVVGKSTSAANGLRFEAFRWTSAGGMVGLGLLPGGNWSGATAVSADGLVVVGSGSAANGVETAFRWTRTAGMQSVKDWLAAAGVTVPATWQLTWANAANADGSIVVGNGSDSAAGGATQAWLARVAPSGGAPGGGAPSGSGIIELTAFNRTVLEAGTRSAQAGVQLPNLTLFGAHHRSLLDSGLARTADGACAWATADAVGHRATGSRAEIAEAGLCKDIGTLRIGLGLGDAYARQDWSLGGGAKYRGQYLVVEAANAYANGMEVSLTGYHGRFSTDLRRNYQNAGAVDTSTGRPDATAAALRARLDWMDAAALGGFSLSPYVAYTWMETRLDAYTENGGGFPVAYAAARWHTDDLRAGLAGRMALSAQTTLRLAGEVAHRFQDTTHGTSGQVLGLWSFSLPGEKLRQDWTRVTVDVDHRFSDKSLLTFGANVASTGGDPSWGVTMGWRMAF